MRNASHFVFPKVIQYWNTALRVNDVICLSALDKHLCKFDSFHTSQFGCRHMHHIPCSAARPLQRPRECWMSLIPLPAVVGSSDARYQRQVKASSLSPCSPQISVTEKLESSPGTSSLSSPSLLGVAPAFWEAGLDTQTHSRAHDCAGESTCWLGSAIRGGTMVHLGYSEFAFSLQPLMQCPYSHQTLLKHLTSHSKALIRGHNGVWLVLAGMDQTQVRCWKQEMAPFFLSSAWELVC